MEQIIQTGHNHLSNEHENEGNCCEVEVLKTKLAELTKEMNQFTYIVSHDLQAPLRMVTGFLELLEKKYSDKLDTSAKQYIDFAVKGAGKMKKLIVDLLDYSRLSSVVKEYEKVDLNEIVQEVKEKFKPVIEEAGVVINSEHLPVFNSNRIQMVQLFENLIENALKFRSDTSPEINITLKKDDNLMVIAIKDNGVGFDQMFSEKIFIVFRRLYGDDSKYSGTGIGLAICKKIAELHGGTIRAESEVSKGSTFYITLPVL